MPDHMSERMSDKNPEDFSDGMSLGGGITWK
jgi:hypothetical protein